MPFHCCANKNLRGINAASPSHPRALTRCPAEKFCRAVEGLLVAPIPMDGTGKRRNQITAQQWRGFGRWWWWRRRPGDNQNVNNKDKYYSWARFLVALSSRRLWLAAGPWPGPVVTRRVLCGPSRRVPVVSGGPRRFCSSCSGLWLPVRVVLAQKWCWTL